MGKKKLVVGITQTKNYFFNLRTQGVCAKKHEDISLIALPYYLLYYTESIFTTLKRLLKHIDNIYTIAYN